MYFLVRTIFIFILFIYLFKSDHQTIKPHTQAHTHYDKIVNFTDAEQLITCTSLFAQDNSLLANVTFVLYTTVLQLGSPNSTNMAQTLTRI